MSVAAQDVPVSIAQFAAEQRRANAQRILVTLLVLRAFTVPLSWALKAPPHVAVIQAISTLVLGFAYWLHRRGRDDAGPGLLLLSELAQHVALVAVGHNLGAIPYLAPVLVLVGAAMLALRRLPWVLALSLGALVAEGLLANWTPDAPGALVTSVILTVVVFVVSRLHVGGTDRALALADAREAARAVEASRARDADERYRLVADNTDDLISVVDAAGHALYLSPSFERTFGEIVAVADDGAPPQLLLATQLQGVDQQHREALGHAFQKALATGGAESDLALPVAGKGVQIFDTQMKRIEGPSGPLIITIARNVTERRGLERQVRASEHLEALGRLAGSVAHDFNNLLTVIGGAAEMLRVGSSTTAADTEDVDAILTATASATRLTRQLLTFSKRQIVFPQGLNLNQQLQSLQPLLQRLVGSRVTLELVGSEIAGSVLMDASHLEQVLMNLAVNARDAMPNGGTLRYALTYRDVQSAESGLARGYYAQIAVTDTGTGISPDVLPRLFDPFFTTKGEQGTGLGLATCHSIVTGLGGAVLVDSSLGKGTTFRVLLPVASTGASVRQLGAAKSFGQVLVVDDELAVRETTARMLRASGYQVVTAGSIEHARRILNDPSVACDALLTDVVLHNERGFELLSDCRRLRPDARIVVMSGFAPEPEAAVALERSAAGFLPKPFSIDELCAALRD